MQLDVDSKSCLAIYVYTYIYKAPNGVWYKVQSSVSFKQVKYVCYIRLYNVYIFFNTYIYIYTHIHSESIYHNTQVDMYIYIYTYIDINRRSAIIRMLMFFVQLSPLQWTECLPNSLGKVLQKFESLPQRCLYIYKKETNIYIYIYIYILSKSYIYIYISTIVVYRKTHIYIYIHVNFCFLNRIHIHIKMFYIIKTIKRIYIYIQIYIYLCSHTLSKQELKFISWPQTTTMYIDLRKHVVALERCLSAVWKWFLLDCDALIWNLQLQSQFWLWNIYIYIYI